MDGFAVEDLENNKILIIDDEIEILEVLSLILSKENYEVFTSSDGESSMDLLRNNNIDLVLCDLNLGEESGISILKSVKIFNPDIHFIMITGFGSIDTAVEAMKYGAFDFIEKPVRRHNIIKVVEKAFQNISLLRENLYLKKQLIEKTKVSFNDSDYPKFYDIKIGCTMGEIENRVIKQTLEFTKGNTEIAAQILGLSIEYILKKMDYTYI
ncbi:response regulator [bacterium]|nr:response regulator [bacterium]